jgi:hypothetical protein
MADEKDYFASAVVTMKIRVTSNGHWGSEATVSEVQRMGGQETINAIQNALRESRLKYEIVGTPEVGAVTWEIKK